MGSSMVDVKQGGWTKHCVSGMLLLMLGGQTPQVNAQDHIVHSGNYCYSLLMVASVDEIKKNSHWKIIMTPTQTSYINIYIYRYNWENESKSDGM